MLKEIKINGIIDLEGEDSEAFSFPCFAFKINAKHIL